MMENKKAPRPLGIPPVPKRAGLLPKRGFRIVSAVLLLAVVCGIILICKSCRKTPDASDFDGIYYIDDYTAYEFDGKGKGALCLGDTTRYVFDYSVRDDSVSLDFEDDRVTDTTYTFTLTGTSITITRPTDANSYTMTKK